jgi:hypothetical protein
MKRGPGVARALFFTALLGIGGMAMSEDSPGYAILLDDFADGDEVSPIGTRWEGFTDQVMGGVSQMQVGVEPSDEGYALHMTGQVSLENNGGFIQARLRLAESGSFDARAYSGVALDVRGRGGNYYLHLKTPRNVFPWAHYEAKLPVTENWRRVQVPFESFEPQYMLGGGRPDTANLRSIAVVAAKAEFQADIWVRSVGLYR